MTRRMKRGQVLHFPNPASFRFDEKLRSLNKIFELFGEIRADLDALELEWSDQWDAQVRKLRAETARQTKVQVMRW